MFTRAGTPWQASTRFIPRFARAEAWDAAIGDSAQRGLFSLLRHFITSLGLTMKPGASYDTHPKRLWESCWRSFIVAQLNN